MSAVADLHQAALDAAVWASNDPAHIAETIADQLAAFVATDEFTDTQRENLEAVVYALRLLADRLEVVS